MKKQQEKKEIHLSMKKVAIGFFLLWGLSIFGTWSITMHFAHHFDNSFPLLNDRLKYEGWNSLEERNAAFFANLIPLRDELKEMYKKENSNISFYIEDLNSGSWTGWQEREAFVSASLLKVPVAIGVMKKIDKEDWTLNTKLTYEEKHKDTGFGKLWEEPIGSEFTIERLISEMLQNSDNTSFRILASNLSEEDFANVYYHIGVVDPALSAEALENGGKVAKLPSKEMASIFRALYNATYLTRKSSNYILDLLTKTQFDEPIPAIPDDIQVAHKIAAFDSNDPNRQKNYHDCGIAYIPSHPYLYCVMTREFDAQKSKEIITSINSKAFLFFNNE